MMITTPSKQKFIVKIDGQQVEVKSKSPEDAAIRGVCRTQRLDDLSKSRKSAKSNPKTVTIEREDGKEIVEFDVGGWVTWRQNGRKGREFEIVQTRPVASH